MAIARVALPVAAWQLFDYWIPDGLQTAAGDIVRVRLAGRVRVRRRITAIEPTSDFLDRVQPIQSVADVRRLPAEIMELATFTGAYYQASPGMAFSLATPPLVRVRRTKRNDDTAAASDAPAVTLRLRHTLTVPQQSAIDAIVAAAQHVLAAAAARRDRRRQDGRLSRRRSPLRRARPASADPRPRDQPDAAAREARAPGVARCEDRDAAQPACVRERAVATGTLPRTAVRGSCSRRRLGVFAPLPRLALIVVDEEHDALVQAARRRALPRARPRRVAGARARRADRARQRDAVARNVVERQVGRYRTAHAARARRRSRALPVIHFVPVRGRDTRDGLSVELRDALATRIAAGEQSLLFINRRGFAPSLMCAACAWESECPRCSARGSSCIVQPERLRCHHCGHVERPPRACPECGNVDLLPVGFGTQRLEQTIRALFPAARIARVDRDTTRTQGCVRRRCASGSRPASSTSSSARRCSRRGTTFRS